MDYRENILALARSNPLLPSSVAKTLSTNSIMAGAMLAEMCDKGMLKTSALRVGSSPLYYIPGNEAQLVSYIKNLNEKDQRVVKRLQEELIIREQNADPLTRVSLTIIKDFAKPLIVEYNGVQEKFWKWFSIPDSQAEELIRVQLLPFIEVKDTQAKPILPENSNVQEKQEITKKIVEEKNEPSAEKNQEQKTLSQEKVAQATKPSGDFWEKTLKFFDENKIVVREHAIVKKKIEFDVILELPSPVGTLQYYCKVRSKKRISEGDLSAAYVQGQMKKLPVIFVTDGELSKQAKVMLEQLKGVAVKQV